MNKPVQITYIVEELDIEGSLSNAIEYLTDLKVSYEDRGVGDLRISVDYNENYNDFKIMIRLFGTRYETQEECDQRVEYTTMAEARNKEYKLATIARLQAELAEAGKDE